MDGTFGGYLRSGLMVSAAIVCMAAATPAMGQERSFNVPEQDAARGVSAFARQADIQLLISAADARGRRTNEVRGTMTVAEGLQRLLAGTGLQARSTGAQTYSVVPVSGEAEAGGAAAVDTGATPEILVVGQRTSNTDIRRTENDAQPYVVLGRDEIDRSQATSVEDFLRTRLPMNNVQMPFSQSAGLGNRSSIDLRGLGTNQTLVLIDGRRVPGAVDLTTIRQPDINGLPISAIERIEILPATASGIHGGGATGGVVNIITRRDYRGVELNITGGESFRGDASHYRIDATAGFTLEEGRTRVFLSVSHASSDPLLNGERNFARRARALQFTNNPAAFFSLATPPLGFTSNIRSVNGTNLVLDNGTPLLSPRTFVPVGYGGPSTDAGVALVANAGLYNLDIPNDPQGTHRSLLVGTEVDSVSLNVRREFSRRVEAFADLIWTRNDARGFLSLPPSSTTLAANAPNNPFNTAIIVSFPGTGLLFPSDNESETVRGTAGIIVRLPHNWTAAADYAYGFGRLTYSSTDSPLGDPDGSGPGIPVTTALSSGALNVMRDLNAFPIDWSPFLLPSPTSSTTGKTNTHDLTLRLSGPLFRLPGGDLTLSGLAEWRREEATDIFTDLVSTTGARSTRVFFGRSQEVSSLYLEARAPLVSARNASPLARSLDIQASVRYDDYTTRAANPQLATAPSRAGPFPVTTNSTNEASAVSFTVGLRYQPVRDLTLRASYGTGFLPPNIGQIVPSAPFLRSFVISDPRRGGVPTNITFTQLGGGNPNLTPEETKSWSAGVVLEPRFAPGLRLSVDYTRLRKVNEILPFIGFQDVVNLEDLLPGRLTRGPLTPADTALGFTGGPITSIDIGALNISRARLDAYDFQADYRFDTRGLGQFHLYAIATWQPSLERQTVPNTPFVDQAGFIAGSVGVLTWRGNAGVNWRMGPWDFSWNAQYYHSYFVYPATASAAQIATAVLNQGSARIPSQIYHDFLLSYEFRQPILRGLDRARISIGIQNAFDRSPPILATTANFFSYSPLGDPRLRRFTLSLRAGF